MTDQVPMALTLEVTVQVAACPTCKQPAGSPCRTPRNRLAPVHSTRYEAAKAYIRDRAKLEDWNRAARPR